MGILINFSNVSFGCEQKPQNLETPQQNKQVSVFNSPFDRKHKLQTNEIPKDGIFQIEDITGLDEYCKISAIDLEPLKKYEGKPWSKRIFNETASFLLDNIKNIKAKDDEEEWAESACVASLLDKLCYKGILLTNENKEKILTTADEYSWQLPKSFRNCLNEQQTLYFDFLADDFERNGMDKYAKEVKEITEDGYVKYED